jgi:hypothetical protein
LDIYSTEKINVREYRRDKSKKDKDEETGNIGYKDEETGNIEYKDEKKITTQYVMDTTMCT